MSYMVQWICKQESGEMVYFPKLSDKPMKNSQAVKTNRDGLCSMGMLMQFGLKT